MFIAPLLVLFLSLTTDFTVINGELLAATRFSALVRRNSSEFGEREPLPAFATVKWYLHDEE